MSWRNSWQTHWIGQNNVAGRVRYWYYRKRGRIVNGQIYYVPGLSESRIKKIYKELIK